MNDREANIDLVFRNGLKDFEVLPPPEIWTNIHPVVRRRQRPLIVLRAAALVTLILSLSFLTYRSSRKILIGSDSAVIALNGESATSLISPSIPRPVKIPVKGGKPDINSVKTLINDVSDISVEPDKEIIISPEVAYLRETNRLSLNNTKSVESLNLAALTIPANNTFKINEVEQQYLPATDAIKGTDRWSIGAMASPTYYSKFNSGNSEISKEMMASEQPLISYSGGVAFSYKINKRFSIQSGLYYSSLGQVVDGINSFSGFQKYDYTKGDHNFEVQTSNGTVFTNNSDVFLMADGQGDRISTLYTNDVFDPKKASLQYIGNTLRQNLTYLELPVILRYKIIDKMIGVNLIGGVSYNLLVNNSVYTVVDGSKYTIGETKGLNPISLSSTLGMGMEYNFSKNLSLNLEPTFRYYLNPFNEMLGSKIHPYSFGIFSGVSYKF